MWLGIEWPHPWWLLAMIAAIPATYWSLRGSGRVVFSSLRALPAGGHTWRTQLAWLPDVLIGLAVVSLGLALVEPRKGDEQSRIRRDGIAIMMAIDVSGSMRALDLSAKNQELTRLDAVKQVFDHFVNGDGKISGRPDDAIGIVDFAKYAETRSPLTLDHANLMLAAKSIDFADENESMTAIGAGLELAVQRLKDFPARSKVAILLTDGESNVHDIDEDTAIDDAVKAGVKVYTIGAGTTGLAPIRVPREGGGTVLMQTEVSIDEDLLRKIAEKTHGQYFRATDHASLAHIYEQIDHLERTDLQGTAFKNYRYFYGWFVGGALLALAAALALRATVLRRLP
ncbi:MAG TPA: VWA domain-containing protein [Kofleriaceae bacterium]|jgi:Ca-activated chloride channel family protein